MMMKSSQNSSSKQQPKLSKQSTTSVENIPPYQAEQNKMVLIESNLNRVCLQQDALMPLLQMIEYIPAIQRTDSIVKGLLRKIEESDVKIARHEKLLEKKFKENSQNDPQEKAPKKAQKQIEEVTQKVKDIEGQMNNLYRWYECKLKEESQQLTRNMDQKLEKQKNEMQRSFFNENSKNPQKNTTAQNPNDKNILAMVDQIVQSQVQTLRENMQEEMQSLRDEIIYLKQQSLAK